MSDIVEEMGDYLGDGSEFEDATDPDSSGEVRANDKPLRKLAPVSPNTNIDLESQ